MKIFLILIFLIRLLDWHIEFEKRKGVKKQLIEDLMQIVRHPKKWQNFSHLRRWEKINRTDSYWQTIKVCVGSMRHRGIETFCLLRYWNILNPKLIKILNYIQSLSILFMLNWFKYFDQKLSKNFSVPSDQNISTEKMFQYPYAIYYWYHLILCNIFQIILSF